MKPKRNVITTSMNTAMASKELMNKRNHQYSEREALPLQFM